MDAIEAIATQLTDKLERGSARDARVVTTLDDYEIIALLERDGRRVSIEIADRTGRIPRRLSLHRSRGARRTTLGAPRFDQTIELSAPEVWALATFGQRTRHLVQIMIDRWGATVESGRVEHHHASSGRISKSEILRTLRAAMDLARAISLERTKIPERLAEHAVEDPEPKLRERALRALVEHHPGRAAVACRLCLDDPEPNVRLVAASSLALFAEFYAAADSEAWAPENRAAVEGTLSELATSWSVGPEVRIAAFDRFIEVSETPLAVLERALADPVLAERAVHATNRVSDPSWADLLVEVADDCDEKLRTAIAIALADVGHPSSESVLLTVPHAHGVPERLAEIGTARAIPILRKVGTREALAAIERIKGRVGDLSGRVAVVDSGGQQGALSEAEAGRVSVAEED